MMTIFYAVSFVTLLALVQVEVSAVLYAIKYAAGLQGATVKERLAVGVLRWQFGSVVAHNAWCRNSGRDPAYTVLPFAVMAVLFGAVLALAGLPLATAAAVSCCAHGVIFGAMFGRAFVSRRNEIKNAQLAHSWAIA